jgi:ribosomal protein S18 acetylase RimI-like enzyme
MFRNTQESDYEYIITRLNTWWGGRNITQLLPRLFFQHFNNSSFVIEENGKIAGFLVGFKSQSLPNTGYIHFVGVDPEHRLKGVASQLYKLFFEYCEKSEINVVKCITSPINTTSIAYHHKQGFQASEYDAAGKPIPVSDYESIGESRVVFSKMLKEKRDEFIFGS